MKKIHTDNDCLALLKKGNTVGLEYLIRVYFPVLVAYAEKIVQNSSWAEDLTEEALIKVWDNRNRFDTFNALKGFLYTTLRNSCLNALRSKRREEERSRNFVLIEAALPDENEFIHEEMMAEIRKALDTLSPKLKEIFMLAYFEGKDNRQIAELLQLSEQTVRNQKTKALAMLRNLLSNKTFLWAFGCY